MRLDIFLVKEGYFESRNKANEAIKQRDILVDAKVVTKPSFEVDKQSNIKILQQKRYVSRAGHKLNEFLKDKNIEIRDKLCLDIGSSTGGFTEVLLEFGAKKVVAVDVGAGQLHKKIKEDKRVESYEDTDIRDFEYDMGFDLLTCDVSFIAIEHILPKIIEFSKEKIILLFKPQFEVGKDVKRDKRGVVKDKKAIHWAIVRFESELVKRGLKLIEKEESKVKGKNGNEEFFYYIQR